jgi:hypothetical protein
MVEPGLQVGMLYAPLDFNRLLNPTQTKGGGSDYDHQSTTCAPLSFQTLHRPCELFVMYYVN